MNTATAAVTRYCKHCQATLSSFDVGEFCCNGCESVFRILSSEGMGDYYALKKDAFCIQPAKPIPSQHEAFNFIVVSNEVKFYIEGVHCSACLWLLERLPKVLPEIVLSSTLNIHSSVLSLKLRDANQINRVAEKIAEWGYQPHLISNNNEVNARIEKENRKRLIEVGVAGALAGNVMLMSIPLYSGVTGSSETLFESLSFLLSIPALFYSGRDFFKNVYVGVRTKTFPIDGPILLALLVAFFYSVVSLIKGTHQLYFDSLTALIFLLLSSRYYLARLRQSSHLNLGVLEYFHKDFAGKVGDLEQLKAGEKIAFDGVVRKGEGWCDHSQFTGESEPVKVQVGDLIYAGTIFLDGSADLSVEVLKTHNDTRLSQLLKKVSEAQAHRTQTELAADRWAKRLLIGVISIAVAAMTYFLIQGNAQEGVRRVLALLIVTCPCALALATPLVFTLAMKSLLKKGLLVKDPSGIDQLADLSEIFVDKTGTLTEGRMTAEFDPTSLNPIDRSALYSLVRKSRHPVSRAIEKRINHLGLGCLEWSAFEEKLGVGLFAEFALGKTTSRYSLVKATDSVSNDTEAAFIKDDQTLVRIVLKDQVREESLNVIRSLHRRGFRVSILSGDRAAPVKRLAEQLNVDGYFADVTPEEKSRLSQAQVMVGDGVNDALALSNAKVSVAVLGGMEAAIQSAQVYSMKPGVALIPELIDTSRLVRKTLKQNFALSSSYNLIGAILSLTGHMNPLIAAVLMPLSALTVFTSTLSRMKGPKI